MDTPKFRPATAADYPAICNLINSAEELFLVHPAGDFPWSITQLERLAEERFALTVVHSAEGIIGFANLYGKLEQQHAFIGNVIIASTQRGRGYGKKLIEYMLHHLFQELRLPEARISVFSNNTPAITLYRSLGFSPYAEELLRTAQGKWQPLIHMRLATHL